MLEDLTRRLIGCDWGSRVLGPQDDRLCDQRAVERIAIHVDADDLVGVVYKFCARHAALVKAGTDRRTAPIADEGER